ncbi:MAG TPA: hypothetical protein VHO91_08760, partial [Rhodopila sp.]|nr:hypothetical protein [Rhodopila sp.]
DPAEMLLIAQSIAFGLAALDTLRLSAEPGYPPNTLVRLRATAVSLSRSADRARTAWQRRRTQAARPQSNATRPIPSMRPAQPAPHSPPNPPRTAAWAAAFADLAREAAAGADPAIRLRADALCSAARTLLSVP